jgi:hypothetical protein
MYPPYQGDHKYHAFRPTDTIEMNDRTRIIFKCVKYNCPDKDTFDLMKEYKFSN